MLFEIRLEKWTSSHLCQKKNNNNKKREKEKPEIRETHTHRKITAGFMWQQYRM